MRSYHIPGMAVAVFRHGKPVQVVVAGYADLENRVRVRRQTQFEICSITKQFTAAAVLLLVQGGKMRLDAPLADYIAGLPSSWSGVTIRRLLQHTSGVPDCVFSDQLTSLPLKDAVQKLVANPLEFRSGTRWSYNNTGYWLVGHAIEKASGMSFFEFLQNRIFDPLGMRHTFPNRPEQVVPWRAKGYAYKKGLFVNASPLTDAVGYAAGGLISTLADLSIWSKALLSGKLLSAESRREMMSPALLTSGMQAWNYQCGGYGLGVFVGSSNGHSVEKHSGGWADASCQLARFANDDLTVVILTNVGGYEQRTYAAERVAHLFVPSIDSPRWHVTGNLQAGVKELASKVLSGLAKGKVPADGSLTPACRKLVLSEMDEIQQSTEGANLKSLSLLRIVPQGDTTVYVTRAIFKRPILAIFTITKTNKVANLQVTEPPAT